MKNLSLDLSKISYIQNEIWKDRTRFRFVTKRSIRHIIETPPFNGNTDLRKLTFIQMKNAGLINEQLVFPLSLETMLDIIRLSEEYDDLIVDNVEVGAA